MAALRRFLWSAYNRHLNLDALKVSFRNKSSLCSTQIIHNDFGDPKTVLQKSKIDLQPQVKSYEILVKMLMAPVNPSDINMIEGTYFIRPVLPAVVGNEGVGEVVAIGDGVTDFCVGDRVIPAEAGLGTWRNFAISSAFSFIKVPNDLPVVSAATLLVNPPTAYRMLKDYVDLKPGDVVIQNGANSSVGQSVIQLAKHWNIATVNIVRDRKDIDSLKNYLKTLGADFVITEEFCRSPNMKDFMKSMPALPKLGLNSVGGKSAAEMLRHLSQGAMMITYGGMSRKPITVPTGALLFKEIKLEGYWNTEWNRRNRGSDVQKEMYQDLCQMIFEGKIKPSAYELFPLDKYDEAVSKSLDGYQNTKKILVLDKNLL